MEIKAKEKVRIYNMTPKKPSSRRYSVDIMISSEDADLIENYHWATTATPEYGHYFVRGENHKNIWLHHVIAQREYPHNIVTDFIVDFINGNTQDLRRNNLRLTNRRGDSLNRSCNSKYCGVTFSPWGYVAANTHNGYVHIGKYDTELEAAIAWGKYNGYDGPVIRERYK